MSTIGDTICKIIFIAFYLRFVHCTVGICISVSHQLKKRLQLVITSKHTLWKLHHSLVVAHFAFETKIIIYRNRLKEFNNLEVQSPSIVSMNLQNNTLCKANNSKSFFFSKKKYCIKTFTLCSEN